MDPLINSKVLTELDIIPKRLRVDKKTSGKEWRKILENKKNEILEPRDIEAFNNKAKHLSTNTEIYKAKLADKQYFMSKAFEASNYEARELINSTVKSFSLNKEQECALKG